MENLTIVKTGYGLYEISCEIDGVVYKTHSRNAFAIGIASDPDYNDNDNSGRIYQYREEAQTELINEIKRNNDLL